MPKPQPIAPFLASEESRSKVPPWQSQGHGVTLAGEAHVTEVDLVAIEMEDRWGVDRLRLLVGPELRERFDRQRRKFSDALWHGELEDVRREAARMVTAWRVLDRQAAADGKSKLDPDVWEVALDDGRVAAIVRENVSVCREDAQGRAMSVFTLAEIGRLISGFPAVVKAKETWPGAMVTRINREISDPVRELPDDPIPF